MDILLLTITIFATVLILVGIIQRRRERPSTTLRAPMFAVRVTLGIIFLILAVIGALLPILQGWVFFGIAMLLLFPQSRFAVKALDKIGPRFPRVVGWLHKVGVGVHHDQSSRHDGVTPDA